MEVEEPQRNKLCRAYCAQTNCRSNHGQNRRRVFRLPRRSAKSESVARFADLNLSRHKPSPRGKSKGGGRSPLLGRFKGFAKGQGSHANPAKRFVWEKEEQRNGRRLSAASGGQDEGCGVCSDATPPLPFSFYRQRLFLCRAKKKGLKRSHGSIPFNEKGLHLRCKLYSPLKRDSAACTPSSIRHSAASAACSSAVCSAG